MAELPVIDAQGWLADHHNGPAPSHVVEAIGDACRRWGLFVLVNHGISINTVFDAAAQFMALPMEDKLKIKRTPDNARGFFADELTKQRLVRLGNNLLQHGPHPLPQDHKQCYDFGYVPHPELPDDHESNISPIEGTNLWPEELVRLAHHPQPKTTIHKQPEFRAVMKSHFKACERASLRLLEALAAALGLQHTALHRYFQVHAWGVVDVCSHTATPQPHHSAFCRINYYPPEPEAPLDAFGVHYHTDAGGLTLLLQDEVAGLEVLHDGTWHLVQPVPGALTINVGDQLQVLSNDQFVAPQHRVRVSREAPRYSIPFFFNPSPSAVIAPLPELLAQGGAPRYRPISWAEFRLKRFMGDVADHGEEVQITHYAVQEGAAAAS